MCPTRTFCTIYAPHAPQEHSIRNPEDATSCPGPREGGGSGLSIQHACLHDQPIVTILILCSIIAGGGGDPSRRVVTRSTPPPTVPGDQGTRVTFPRLLGAGSTVVTPPARPENPVMGGEPSHSGAIRGSLVTHRSPLPYLPGVAPPTGSTLLV